MPILQGYVPNPIPQVALTDANEVLTGAQSIDQALLAGNNASALVTINNLLPVFEKLTPTDLAGSEDASIRTDILLGFASADIALNVLGTFLNNGAVPGSSPSVAGAKKLSAVTPLQKFLAKKVWGRSYAIAK